MEHFKMKMRMALEWMDGIQLGKCLETAVGSLILLGIFT